MTPWVRGLLFANVAAFFVQLTMPGLANALVFVPALVLLRPWSVVTYMFLHGGLMHIAFNMVALYFFGPQVEARLGSRRFATLYFLSGVSGALLSAAMAPRSPIIGASAAVFGVMLAFAYFWPDALVHIWGVLPIRARPLVIITTVLALWSGLAGARSGIAHFAHLGGYAGAYLYLRWLGQASETRRRKFRQRTVPEAPRLANWRSIDTGQVHEVNREELNRILDKINASGLESLTEQERTFLASFVPADGRAPPVS